MVHGKRAIIYDFKTIAYPIFPGISTDFPDKFKDGDEKGKAGSPCQNHEHASNVPEKLSDMNLLDVYTLCFIGLHISK